MPPHSFGRAIDDAIAEFRRQLVAEREMQIAEMRKEIVGPLQALRAELSRDLARCALRLAKRDCARKQLTPLGLSMPCLSRQGPFPEVGKPFGGILDDDGGRFRLATRQLQRWIEIAQTARG